MMPLVTFADPTRAIVDYLAVYLPDRPEPYVDGVTIGVWRPSDSSMESPTLPFVQVASDGTPTVRWPVFIRSTVRITIWHTNPGPAAALASLVFGLMSAHPGDDRVWCVYPFTGPLPGIDDVSGAYLNSLTFGVSVRPAAA